MRLRSFVQLVAASVCLGAVPTAGAQGSWLPYGTIGASDVAVSPAGVVWLIGIDPRSLRSTLVLGETRFSTPAGSPTHVAVDLNGFPWLLNSDGSIWHWVRNAAGKEDWEQSSLKAIDIAVGASGAVWAIDTGHRVVQLKNGSWESIGGSGVKISVDPSGNPWIVNAAGQVSHWNGKSWTAIAGNAIDISVAPDGNVFILGPTPVRGGFEILRLDGSTWDHIVGGGGVAISAGSKAVFVAQDTTTNLVLSSANVRLRVASSLASTQTGPSPTAPLPADAAASTTTTNGVATVASLAAAPSPSPTSMSPSSTTGPVETSKNSGTAESGSDKGGSIPHPSAGSIFGAIGALGGLAVKAAPALIPAIPTPGSIAQAAAGAAAGAVAGAAVNAAGNAVGSAVGKTVSSLGSGGAPEAPSSRASTPTQTSAQAPSNSLNPPKAPSFLNMPSVKLPMPGSLRCPVIGGGAAMERGCEFLGRQAMKLWHAPSADCAAPAFADSRNGGECWSCPNSFTRSSTAVDAADACVGPAAEHSVATLVKGCATYNAPPGYGTPFRDSPTASECLACPLPLQWSWSSVTSLTRGNLEACVGKAKQLLVWQLGQFPESGTYRFMPGLLLIALKDPKAIDAFLEKRANGDTTAKRAMWAAMISDPSSSAELKALLFASLLSVAKQDSASAEAKHALSEFESYVQRRRSYVAGEAFRMFKKASEVDSAFKQARDSGTIDRIRGEAVETAATDFKTYAWSSVVPDSAGTAFILASAALSRLGVSGGAEGAVDAAFSSLNGRYLAPVTKALEDGLDMLQGKGADAMASAGTLSTIANRAIALQSADPAMIRTTLLGGAMKVSRGVMNLFGKDKVAAEYEKYVGDMSLPIKVKEMMDSTKPEDRQSLLLYWALATSAHEASDKLGTGALTGAALCASDSWTAAECSSAKALIQAAAKEAGYSTQ